MTSDIDTILIEDNRELLETLRQKIVVIPYEKRLIQLKNIFSTIYKKMIRNVLKTSKYISELIKSLRQKQGYPMSQVATFSFSGGSFFD